MSNHNYSQYSNNKKNRNYNRPKVEEADESFVPVSEVTVTAEAPVVVPEIKMVVESCESAAVASAESTEPVMPAPQSKMVTGVVFNCSKLNVRVEPSIEAEVVFVLDRDSEMEIDMAKSTRDWFRVCTAAGIDGYCMRKFVSVRL